MIHGLAQRGDVARHRLRNVVEKPAERAMSRILVRGVGPETFQRRCQVPIDLLAQRAGRVAYRMRSVRWLDTVGSPRIRSEMLYDQKQMRVVGQIRRAMSSRVVVLVGNHHPSPSFSCA